MSFEKISIDDQFNLVQLQPEQADRLFALTDRNREYLGEFLPWVPYVKTVEDSHKHIMETLENRTKGSSYTYGIEYDGDIVGDISIRNLKEPARPPEIGYWIAPEQSGKGITTKSVQALTHFGLVTLGLNKIIIRANPDNAGSNRVAEKAGYQYVGQEVTDTETYNVWSTPINNVMVKEQ